MDNSTLDEEEIYRSSDTCHICEKSLIDLPPTIEKQVNVLKKKIQFFKTIEDMLDKLKESV